MFSTRQDFEALRNFGKQLSQSGLKDSIIISCNARDLVKADRVSVYAYDRVKKKLWTLYAQGASPIELDTDKGIAGHVFTSAKPYYTNSPQNDPYYYHRIEEEQKYPVSSIAAVPILNHSGQAIGVLQLINKLEGAFHDEDMVMLKFFSHFLQSFLVLELMRSEAQSAPAV